MNEVLALGLAFVVYAGGAFLAVRGLEMLVPFRDAAGTPLAPTGDALLGALGVGTGVVGAVDVWANASLPSLVIVGAVCIVLDYACCADLRSGRVPLVVGVPLALVVGLIDAADRDLVSVAAGLLIAAPFAFAALSSRGRSAGGGDAGVAAMGGFVLGAELGILAVAIACFAAAGTGFFTKRQGAKIPFAPFLAITMQLALLFPGQRAL